MTQQAQQRTSLNIAQDNARVREKRGRDLTHIVAQSVNRNRTEHQQTMHCTTLMKKWRKSAQNKINKCGTLALLSCTCVRSVYGTLALLSCMHAQPIHLSVQQFSELLHKRLDTKIETHRTNAHLFLTLTHIDAWICTKYANRCRWGS